MNFTKQEDNIILSHLKKDPGNISRACQELTNVLPHRSLTSIKGRYYNTLKKHNNIIAVASSSGNVMIGKNDPRNNDKVNTIIVLSNTLSKSEKKQVITSLFNTL
tara:strand:+ start:559 stop:873 length:315 start_codon:yes stop_codon:yes gene_type:complete